MLTYKQALDYIYGFANWETRGRRPVSLNHFDLARVEALLERLGNPHRRFQSVHIAGTKGKGSVAAMLHSVLRAAGYRTGLYTSPHLHTFRERIQVDGQLISEREVSALAERLQPVTAVSPGVTTFEVMTAMAFQHFADRGVEVAVVEVGLGGRLDATNVIVPLTSVITSLSLDHTAILGRTLPEIAREKAGIIKPQVPVVSAPQPPDALAVIRQTCLERHAPLTVVGEDWTWELVQGTPEGQSFVVREVVAAPVAAGAPRPVVEIPVAVPANPTSHHLWIPLLGRHQLVNATVAVATVAVLRERGLTIPEVALERGMREMRWPGRVELLGRRPWVVVDGAHNPASVSALLATVDEHFPHRRFILVFGASYDKDIVGMLRILLPRASRVLFARARHPRAAGPIRLQEMARELGFQGEARTSVTDALKAALDNATEEDLVCVAGSLFVMAEARETWAAMHRLPLPERDPPAGDWARTDAHRADAEARPDVA